MVGAALERNDELHTLPISKLSELLADRSVSYAELVEAYLSRALKLNGRLHGYITMLPEAAAEAARKLDKSTASRGSSALRGIPYGLKDAFYCSGIRTTAASRVLKDWVPTVDSTIYRRLAESGAILLGKQNTWEYGTGLGEVDDDPAFPQAVNPWDEHAFTGGSSSGTATCVAAGLAAFGIGADTGGSVRAPAAAQALFGLKPTYGCLSRFGILPNSPSFDHAGVIARRAADAALVLDEIAGSDPRDLTTVGTVKGAYLKDLRSGIKGLRIGVIRTFHERDIEPDPDVGATIDEALRVLRDLGAEIVDIGLHHRLQDHRLCKQIIGQAESLSVHGRDFCERHAEMSQPLQDKFLSSLVISGVDVFDAMKWRTILTNEIDAAFDRCDVVVCAGPLHVVPGRDDMAARKRYMLEAAFCSFNVSGHPAAALCSGFDRAGRPLSIQVVGRYFDEQMVLRVAHAYECATRWHDEQPACRVSSSPATTTIDKQGKAPASTVDESEMISEDFVVSRLKMLGMADPPADLVHRARRLNADTLRSIGALPRNFGRDVDFCYYAPIAVV